MKNYQKNLLIPLLMAIVMMAMSPQKMWADPTGTGTEEDPYLLSSDADYSWMYTTAANTANSGNTYYVKLDAGYSSGTDGNYIYFRYGTWVLDLNGKTINIENTSYNSAIEVAIQANLTIKDSSTGKTGLVKGYCYGISVGSNVSVTIEGGTFEAAYYGLQSNGSNSSIILHGGTFRNTTPGLTSAISVSSMSDVTYTGYHFEDAEGNTVTTTARGVDSRFVRVVQDYDANGISTDGYQKPTSGDGSSASPYQITNAGNLLWFMTEASKANTTNETAYNAELTADIVVNQNVLNADGTLNTTNGTPAIQWVMPACFYGTFNGNNHTISGIYKPGSSDNAAMFGKNNGTIRNLGVLDSYFGGNCYHAATFAASNYGTITDCYSFATIVGTSYNGGIAGESGSNVISNCFFAGKMTSTSNTSAPICSDYNDQDQTSTAVHNNYFLESCLNSGMKNLRSTSVTSAEMQSGKVAYLLQAGRSTAVWGQNLTTTPTDAYPVLGAAAVYATTLKCDGTVADNSSYSNSNNPTTLPHNLTHAEAKAAEGSTNGNIECWACSVCGKHFSDAAGANEMADGSWMIMANGSASNPVVIANDADYAMLQTQAGKSDNSSNTYYVQLAADFNYSSDSSKKLTFSSGTWTIDLNGHAITVRENAVKIDGANVTINDNSSAKSGAISGNSYQTTTNKGVVFDSGTLLINGGTFNGGTPQNAIAGGLVINGNYSNVTLHGGTFNILHAGGYSNLCSLNMTGYAFFDASSGDRVYIPTASFAPGNSQYLSDVTVKEYVLNETDAAAAVTVGETTTYYETLTEAFTAAALGTTSQPAKLKVLKTYAVDNQGRDLFTLTSGVMTIDLNGKTLQANQGGNVFIVNGADVTVEDNSTSQNGVVCGGGSYGLLYISGKVKVKGGKFIANQFGLSVQSDFSEGDVTLHGGKFYGIYVYDSANWSKLGMTGYAFYDENGNEVVIPTNSSVINGCYITVAPERPALAVGGNSITVAAGSKVSGFKFTPTETNYYSFAFSGEKLVGFSITPSTSLDCAGKSAYNTCVKLTAGTTYKISTMLGSSETADYDCTLTIAACSAPDMGDAITAGTEVNVTDVAAYSHAAYSFTPAQSGVYSITTTGHVTVWPQAPIAANEYKYMDSPDNELFYFESGTTYRIVATNRTSSISSGKFTVAQTTVPEISTTASATISSLDNSKTVMYKFVAPESKNYVISNDANLYMYLYSDKFAKIDDDSELSFGATAGSTYYVCVYNNTGSAVSSATVSVAVDNSNGVPAPKVTDETSPFYDYYAISEPEHLLWFAKKVNYKDENNTYPNVGIKAYLADNISMSTLCHAADATNGTQEVNWTPIGLNSSFTGIFDGNNKTISNLYINDPDEDYKALFGRAAEDAEIKNLTVKGNVTAEDYAALILAYAKDRVKLTNCKSEGAVTGSGENIAGIVAYFDADEDNIPTIAECKNSATITSTCSSRASAGGIVGYAYDVYISKCTNEATVTADGYNVGGIVGYIDAKYTSNPSSISECTNTGAISSTYDGSAYAGGIAGCAYDVNISKCTNEATVTVAGDDVAGIAGYIESDDSDYPLSISECKNTGAISSTYDGDAYIGGIAGYADDASISKCTNEATITAAGSDVGGIVGDFDPSNQLSISECKNTGAISSTYNGDAYIGGIAGRAYDVNISKCSNDATVTAAGSEVGGIVGYLSTDNTSKPSSISECKNSGAISTTYNGSAYIGGIVGDAYYGNISKCSNEATVTAAGYYVGGVVGYVDYTFSVSECKNTGNITSNYSSSSDGAYVGGIIGCYSNSNDVLEMSQCNNTGKISSTAKYVGGLGGYIYAEASGSTIKNCYTTGDVIRTTTYEYAYAGGAFGELICPTVSNVYSSATIAKNAAADYVGAFAGYLQYSTLTDCYYDSNKTSLGFNGYEADNTIDASVNGGKSTAEFASGEVCYLLNGSSDQNPVWHQFIGIDNVPTLVANQYAVVHYDNTLYYNTPIDAMTLTDATAYDGENAGAKVITLTYKRNFANTTYNALYVPFQMSYSDWSEKADVYRLLNIFEEDEDDNGTIDKWVLKIVKLKAGESIKANTPYIIKPKATGDMEITLSNVILASAQEKSIWCASTDYKFVFTGTYAQKDITDDTYFAMSPDGGLQYTESTVTLKPQRWYMGIYNKDTDALVAPTTFNPQANPAKAIVISCDDEDVTGIDEVSGFKSQVSGKFIENGKVVIVRNGKKFNLNGQAIQ